MDMKESVVDSSIILTGDEELSFATIPRKKDLLFSILYSAPAQEFSEKLLEMLSPPVISLETILKSDFLAPGINMVSPSKVSSFKIHDPNHIADHLRGPRRFYNYVYDAITALSLGRNMLPNLDTPGQSLQFVNGLVPNMHTYQFVPLERFTLACVDADFTCFSCPYRGFCSTDFAVIGAFVRRDSGLLYSSEIGMGSSRACADSRVIATSVTVRDEVCLDCRRVAINDYTEISPTTAKHPAHYLKKYAGINLDRSSTKNQMLFAGLHPPIDVSNLLSMTLVTAYPGMFEEFPQLAEIFQPMSYKSIANAEGKTRVAKPLSNSGKGFFT